MVLEYELNRVAVTVSDAGCRKLLAGVMHELLRRGVATDDIPVPTHPEGRCGDGCMERALHSATWLGICYVPGAPPTPDPCSSAEVWCAALLPANS